MRIKLLMKSTLKLNLNYKINFKKAALIEQNSKLLKRNNLEVNVYSFKYRKKWRNNKSLLSVANLNQKKVLLSGNVSLPGKFMGHVKIIPSVT